MDILTLSQIIVNVVVTFVVILVGVVMVTLVYEATALIRAISVFLESMKKNSSKLQNFVNTGIYSLNAIWNIFKKKDNN